MEKLIPHSVAYWTGFVLIALLMLAIVLVIAFIVIGTIWKYGLRKLWFNDWVAYYIRRKTIPTEDLRRGYENIPMNKYWKRETAKYRLRNIKHAKKHTSC